MAKLSVSRPNRLFCIGRNYSDHAKELGNTMGEEPILFLKMSSCAIADGAAIVIPPGIGRVDFEGELAVVLGMGGKNIAEAEAMSHVAGYTIGNDITARDMQKAAQAKGQPWFRSKSLDTFAPLGPHVVTREEIPDPHVLRLVTTVNGETKQDGSTADMVFRIPFLISYLSRWFVLEEDDVILTGTPAGVGAIVPGDSVAVTIEGIGTLTNPVISADSPSL